MSIDGAAIAAASEPGGTPTAVVAERETAGSALEARRVTVRFEGVTALEDVDLRLQAGEILGLIGPNGAGKTTMVNVLTGFQKPHPGSVWIDDRDISSLPAHRRAHLGISRSFQSTRLFAGLTVLENVEMGGLGMGLRTPEAVSRAVDLLSAFDLGHIAYTAAGALPHGEQRRIGILRALASQPTFLLLDEPAAGLDEAETDELMKFIHSTRDHMRCGILVIEHDMRVIMGLCERIQVLDFGKTIAVGSCQEVRCDPLVIAAYLGEEESV